MAWLPAVEGMLLWSALTIGIYSLVKLGYRRWPLWWLSPLALTPALLIALALLTHQPYAAYARDTRWLSTLIGPATVAFAIPLYEQRALIRRHWTVLLLGATCGSVVAMLSAWYLAHLLGLDRSLQLSLMPRSISTPFAVAVSKEIGGLGDLTAVFVVITGVLGALLGDLLLARFSIRSPLVRGSLLGMGAHGAGTAKAYEIGSEEGAVAGMMMVMVGVLNVLAAPLIERILR